MPQTILRRTYLNQFKALYDGTAWLGENFKSKLDDVSSDEAFSIPVNGLRSIAEYLFHIIAWRRSVIYRLEGGEYPIVVDSEKDWANLDKLKKQGWDSLKIEFEEIQKRGVIALENIDDRFLKNPFGDHGFNYEFLVEGMIHHDVYHLSQIGIVKKLLRLNSHS